MTKPTEIVRREQGDALSTIVGTGDTRAMLAQVEKNVRDIVEVGRARGFVTHYRNENKKTGEVRESDFYGLPMWQLLAMTYGVTPVVDQLDVIDGGFKAHAVAQTRDGSVVGGAFGLCHRKEPGKQYKSDHDLAAMAQSRAERNALRTAMGAVLVLAGFDFPDPEGPATKAQIGLLHQLERELGMTHEQGHEAAGADSYKELTREDAAEVIDQWQSELEKRGGAPGHDPGTETGGVEAEAEPPVAPSDGGAEVGTQIAPDGEKTVSGEEGPTSAAPDEPATNEQWARALKLFTNQAGVLRAHAKRFNKSVKASDITRDELAELIREKAGTR